ncbi:HVM14 protein, partial [Polyodon spathula]|nr:HVM14 protein [Polyodon spathula]
FSGGINIRQSPPSLLESPGHSAELSCSHDDNNYDRIYWYQQTRKGALELIGYLSYKVVNQEEKFKERFNLTGDAEKAGSLIISSVTAEDSAVYFCAASI